MASLYLKSTHKTLEDMQNEYKNLFLIDEKIKFVFGIDDSDGKVSYISSKFKDDIVSINMSENTTKSEKFCVITNKRMLYIYDDFYCYEDMPRHFKKDNSIPSLYVDSKSLSKIVSKVSFSINPVGKQGEGRMYLGDMKIVFCDGKNNAEEMEALYKFFSQILIDNQ